VWKTRSDIAVKRAKQSYSDFIQKSRNFAEVICVCFDDIYLAWQNTEQNRIRTAQSVKTVLLQAFPVGDFLVDGVRRDALGKVMMERSVKVCDGSRLWQLVHARLDDGQRRSVMSTL